MDLNQFETRKQDHIRHALSAENQTSGASGLGRVHLVHEALPELDFEEVTLACSVLGTPIATPLFVPGMTAGHERASIINERLALACQERGWVMGIGSQRRQLAQAEWPEWKEFRKRFPKLFLVGNIGLSQLIHSKTTEVLKLIESVEAQALAIHLNVLQEALQPEGTPHFKGGIDAIRSLCQATRVPILLKETGCGISRATFERIAGLPIAAVDVSGLGGTHWGRIEGRRALLGSMQSEAAQTFADWGEPTLDSVIHGSAVLKNQEVWGSGGVRSGLDAAKLLAVGAHRVGLAQPALKAALEGDEALQQWMAQIEYELRVALFCTGSRSPQEIRQKGLKGEGWQWTAKG